jgi:Ca2+-binding RTX toxin-like protein
MVGRAKLVAVLAAFVGLGLVQTGSAWAESCTFANGKVTATITAGSEATLRVSGSEIWFGQVPAPCGGATTANAGSIDVFGSAGTVERLIIDESTGTFTPGSAPEADLVSEIEMAVQLFDATDRVLVVGTATGDVMKLGEGGLRLFADNDADVTFGTRPLIELDGLAGNDEINARGGGGAGAVFLGPVTAAGGEGNDILRGGEADDVLNGGPGDDQLDAQGGNDNLTGGDGADKLDGGLGNDSLEGGAGVDNFYGRDGDDVLNAFVGAGDADGTINGGLNTDKAYLDPSDDPKLTPGVETIVFGSPIPTPPPPPPPTGPCVYNATTQQVTITMAAGVPGTLKVVGEQFVWATSAGESACPTATRANTGRVNVFGQPGPDVLTVIPAGFESESVVIDLRDSSESIENVRILGGDGSDSFKLDFGGHLNIDVDATHEISVTRGGTPFELHAGGGESNFVSAEGYFGRVRIFAGDRGDIIRGGEAADELHGGAGADSISGFGNADLLNGGGGDDDLRGGGGADTMNGGGGNDALLGGHDADTLNGDEGDDTLDGRRPADVVEDPDASFDGGPGNDTAYVDPGEGHKAVNVETLIGDDPAPPPPPNACDYEPVSKQITVRLAAGGQATFKVVGGAIYLGDTPCGAATVTTTSRIVVSAPAGGVERVEVDQRGGVFRPGHVDEAVNPEPTDQTLRSPTISEVEFFLDLGNDAGDTVAVRGTAANDLIAAGPKGVVVDGDGDTDIFVTPAQWSSTGIVEMHGEGGQNTLNAGGAPGTGGYFSGKARLFAGGLGDTLSGSYGNDELTGGAGADAIDGGEGADVIVGGGANDTLRGNGGADDITGGTGADTMIGGAGADTFRAVDGAADTSISCGADVDTAHYDGAFESPVGCEIRFPV